MKRLSRVLFLSAIITGLLCNLGSVHPVPVKDKPPAAAPQAWTLDEALETLKANPHDPYLQYVVLRLAQREGKTGELQDFWRWSAAGPRTGRREAVDLFSIFNGALAVQESLQLETLEPLLDGRLQPPAPQPLVPANEARPEPPAPKAKLDREGKVHVDKLTGPSVESHPWNKMLAGRKPAVSRLARCVPHDNYFAEFGSLGKCLDLLEVGDLWGGHLYSQAFGEARTLRVGERYRQQLALEAEPTLRRFYDLVVSEVALTGSDLYLREGSDLTLLFVLKQPAVFKARMDEFLTAAAKANKAAERGRGEYQGVAYESLMTPDRSVNVYSAYPRPDLHVRGNSRAGLERVLDAIRGKDAKGQAVKRLGDTEEFAYVRTLMPRGAAEEDGLIYLSDPFIRRQVGARVKLTERRRMLCYNHLRMIGHAALFQRTQFGKAGYSLKNLEKTGAAPGLFGAGKLTCPDGGTYTLAADGMSAVCSHHGHANNLTPCCDLPLTRVAKDEALAYEDFVKGYDTYWRSYFDPIAIRVQVRPERYRIETLVLPLIDNSIYSGLKIALGGKPKPLDSLPVPKKTIFSLALQLDQQSILRECHKSLKTDQEEPAAIAAMLAGAPGTPFPACLPWGALYREDTIAKAAEEVDPELEKALKKIKVPQKQIDRLKFKNTMRLIRDGVTGQIALNVYDAEPAVDFNWHQGAGEWLPGQTAGDGTWASVSFLVFSLISGNLPGYFAIPLHDTKLADEYVEALDAVSLALARDGALYPELPISTDFYRTRHRSGQIIRGNNIKLGALKWRFFTARIGKAFYIATRPYIMDDLIAAEAERQRQGETAPAAQAMIRVRPENWKKTLPDYRLGWAENHRCACQRNLASLTGVSRAFGAFSADKSETEEAALRRGTSAGRRLERLAGSRLFCPEGGRYLVSHDGREVTCSVHGSLAEPRQEQAPAADGPMGKLLRQFRGMTVSCQFLDDGLRAVMVVERNPNAK